MAAVVGDDRAFHAEQAEERRGHVIQRLEIALTLGDDEIGPGEAAAELGRAVIEHGAGHAGAVVELFRRGRGVRR